jgi:hypothetical protein
MSIRIEHDAKAPNASIELTIRRPLPDYDIAEIEHPIPRDVDVVLASQGFHDLLDEARGILGTALHKNGLQVVQLTGAICSEGRVHRAGLWLVLREEGAPAGAPMSGEAKTRVTAVADELRRRLQLS